MNERGVRRWAVVPCGDGRVCVDGACPVIDALGSDLAASAIMAIPWGHPDIGIPPDMSVAGRPDRFALGLVVGNVFERESALVLPEAPSVPVPGGAAVEVLRAFDDRVSMVPAPGESASLPVSIYHPDGAEHRLGVAHVPIAAWAFSPSWPVVRDETLCPVSVAPPDCATSTFEGTLISGGTARFESIVGGSLPRHEYFVLSTPAEVSYDTCAERVVIEGLPFFGVSTTAAVELDVTPSADLLAAEDPEPTPGSAAPRAVAAGATARVRLAPGGFYQATARPPADRAECDPEPGDGCVRRCRWRPDLSGTVVATSNRVDVLAGHTCGRLEPGDACSYFAEQVPMEFPAGSVHLVPGPRDFEDLVRLRIVTRLGDAELDLGGDVRLLRAGAVLDWDVTASFVLRSSRPTRVARISRRASDRGAAALTILSALFDHVSVVPPMEDARIVIATLGAGEVRLAGVPLTPTEMVGVTQIYDAEVPATGPLVRIESEPNANVIFAVLPRGSRSFAITRGARANWSTE